MPQWDFLDFLADQGRRYKKRFDLRMRAEATALIEQRGRVVGVRARTPRKELEIRADLVVGCDGRHSDIRRLAGLPSEDYGAPMDVLWFRLSRKKGDRPGVFGRAEAGVLLVMLDRGDYWQCAFVIPKGGMESVKAARPGGVPGPHCRDRAGDEAARRRDQELGRREALDRRG